VSSVQVACTEASPEWRDFVHRVVRGGGRTRHRHQLLEMRATAARRRYRREGDLRGVGRLVGDVTWSEGEGPVQVEVTLAEAPPEQVR
jgi:hypothetical protein